MRGSLPGMIDFYERHGDDGRFEILAFHDDSVQTLEQLDTELARRGIVEKLWKGRPLPFPVLLDASGATMEQFGIHAFPTTILVDPQGRFVKKVDGVDELRRVLGLEADGPSGDAPR